MTTRILNPGPSPSQVVIALGVTALTSVAVAGGIRAYRGRKGSGDELPDVVDDESDDEESTYGEVDVVDDDTNDGADGSGEPPEGDSPSKDGGSKSLVWIEVDPQDNSYPWEQPALEENNYPTPGTFFNVGVYDSFDPAQGFDRFVEAVLASALAMAGNDPNLAYAKGQEAGASLARDLRRAVRKSIIVAGGVNDLAYGQVNLNYAGGNDPNAPGGDDSKPLAGEYVLNEFGRSLNWRPVHANNLNRIQSGQALKRTTTIGGEKLPKPNRGSHQMLLWVPAYDLDLLSPDRAVPAIGFLEWSDGQSTIDPPPQVVALGVLSDVEF